MIDKPIDRITEADIDDLVAYQRPESRTLDFKECLPGDTPATVRGRKDDRADQLMEFARDVAAFANTEGGDLVFGVTEQQDDRSKPGYAVGVPGIVKQSIEAVVRDMEGFLIAKLRPKVQGIRFVPVPRRADPDRPAMVVRVPRSFTAPHMMPDHSFPGRLNTRNEAFDVDQIRSAFLAADALPERMQRFRDQRLARIAGSDRLPASLGEGGKVVLHIVPIASLDRSTKADLFGLMDYATSDLRMMPPSPQPGRHCTYNFEGFAVTAASRRIGGQEAYIQVFRNGAIEAVGAAWLVDHPDYGAILNPRIVEAYVTDRLSRYMGVTRRIGMAPPAFIMLSLVGASQYQFAPNRDPSLGLGQPMGHDPMPLPECYWEGGEAMTDAELAPRILRPAFDSLWQAGGVERSPSYLEDGSWSQDGETPHDFSKFTAW